MILKTYPVKLETANYEIVIGRDLLADNTAQLLTKKTNNKKVLIVTDLFFAPTRAKKLQTALSDHGYEVCVHAMPAGKHNKTINEAIKIYEILENKGFSRDSTLIALGGGVVGDLSGFVASTYYRGMNFVTVPTTMMAMIDSSIGGKVAINFRKTINAIGNYYHPLLNIIDFDFLPALQQRDLLSGLAEVIKCAVIADHGLFSYLNKYASKILERNENELLHAMSRAIEIKLDHVAHDVREAGKRLKLNYGHTMGHAIEASTDVIQEVYRHGEGVALGMIGAAFIAYKHLGQSPDILKQHEAILLRYNLPITVEAQELGFTARQLKSDCLENIYKDKKKHNGKLRFILPKALGDCGVYSDVADSLVKEAFDYLIKGD